ncbi:unnamed protein product [Meloidogyne enterolobii]|uniref:Uncharacterized protein n=1 Tax=Meloidogyne enterolobii TaxID=390850 RepID=A0ACB1AHK2_MELEN
MKSSPLSYFKSAVTILLLLLLGGMMVNNTATATGGGEENEVMQAEEKERPVGLAGHTLDDRKKKVTLFEGSKPATTKEDYEGYKKKYPEACDVELGEDQEKGYIILSYSKTSKAAESGCTVDLYTDLEDKIEFSVFLRNVEGGGPAGCLKQLDDKKFDGYNDNVLPFAYSHPTILEELRDNGPKLDISAAGCKSDVCFDKVCIKKTGLELRWAKSLKNVEHIDLLINPIGSPSYKHASEEMKLFEKRTYGKVKIEKADKYSVRFDGKKEALEPYNEYNCTQNPAGNILTPLTWEINGTNPVDPKKKHLLAFHLLPQKASRMIQWVLPPLGNKIPKGVSEESPKGPECEELQILFSTANYDLLTVVPQTTTTTTSSTTTTTTQPTTTTVTTTTEEPKSSAWIIIVVVVVLLLCSSCAGALVFFFFLKKGGGGDGADDEDKSKMGDNKKSKKDEDGTKSKNDKGTKSQNDKGTKSQNDKGTKSKGDNTKSLTSMNDKTTNSAAAGGGVKSSRVKDAEEGDNKKGTSTAIDNTASLEL